MFERNKGPDIVTKKSKQQPAFSYGAYVTRIVSRNYEGGEFKGFGSVNGVESCTVIFPGGHFLFISSDTFAVGYIV